MVATESTEIYSIPQMLPRPRRIGKAVDRPGMVDNWYSKSTSQAVAARRRLFPGEKVSRPFKCAHCKKRFAKKHHLTLHEKIHASEEIPTGDFTPMDSDDDGETLDCDKINEKLLATESFRKRILKKKRALLKKATKKVTRIPSERSLSPELSDASSIQRQDTDQESTGDVSEDDETMRTHEDGIEEGVFHPPSDDDEETDAVPSEKAILEFNSEFLRSLDKGLEEENWLSEQLSTPEADQAETAKGEEVTMTKTGDLIPELQESDNCDLMHELIANFEHAIGSSEARTLVLPASLLDELEPSELFIANTQQKVKIVDDFIEEELERVRRNPNTLMALK